MTKIKNNVAEIIVTTLAIVALLSSCSNHYTCPSYATITPGAGADWTEGIDENDEQSRPNLVFLNH